MKPNERERYNDRQNNRDEDPKTKSNQRGKRKKKNNKRNNKTDRNYSNRDRSNSARRVDAALESGLYADNTSARNDVGWYTRNPELIEAAARLANPYRPGTAMDMGTVTANSVTYKPKLVVPGVMGLDFIPTIGYSDDTNSPASICAARMWAQVRSKFSSDLTADPADLFMYVYALGNIHAYIEYLKRLYRTINTYSQDNYDYPTNVLIAQLPKSTDVLVDGAIQNLRNNRVKLYMGINELVNAVNVFRLPNQYPIIDRMKWLNQHVYLDENKPDAQTYIFRSMCYYMIDDTGDNGTTLVPHQIAPTILGDLTANLLTFGWNMLSALQNWEDAYTINGYIGRAWDGAQALIESYLSEYEVLAPVYVPEVLHQIENANICPVNTVTDTQIIDSISQNPLNSVIIHRPRGVLNYGIEALVLNQHDMVSEASNIIGTRLSTLYDNDTTADNGIVISGTEILHSVWLCWKGGREQGGSTTNTYSINVNNDLSLIVQNGTTPAATVLSEMHRYHTLLSLQYWHHHPTMYVHLGWKTTGIGTDTDAYIFREQRGIVPMCDLDRPTLVQKDWLKQLHRVTLYSLFNVFHRNDVISENYQYR